MASLSDKAKANLTSEEIVSVQLDWSRGDYGLLCDVETDNKIRIATEKEALESLESSDGGIIIVDGEPDGCYVQPTFSDA